MLPVIVTQGDAYRRGYQHGRALADAVHANVALYYRRFKVEVGVPEATARHLATEWQTLIAARHPEYSAGIRGIADGSGAEFMDVVMINVRYEIIYAALAKSQDGVESPDALRPIDVDGCTSFGLDAEATADAHVIMGQNWDWIPDVRGAVVVSHDEPGQAGAGYDGADQESPGRSGAGHEGAGRSGTVVAFTEAGIFGEKIGFNRHGVGLAINGLLSDADKSLRDTLPVHARCYDVLRATDLEQAVAAVTTGDRTCSTNFVIGQAGRGVRNIEAAPDATWLTEGTAGRIVHANHFRGADAMGITEVISPRRHHSEHRERRLGAILAGHAPTDGADGPARPTRRKPSTMEPSARRAARAPHSRPDAVGWSVEGIQAALRDHDGHPNSVCRHPDPSDTGRIYESVVSAVMDLDAGTLWISDGPPCRNPYQEVHMPWNL